MSYTNQIKKYLSEIGGENITEVDAEGQAVIGFSYIINEKKMNIAIFHGSHEDRIIFQIFCSLPNAYNEPDKILYKIIEKLNVKSIIGSLFFAETDGDYFISYKSNLVHEKPIGSFKNVELFITTSLQIISINDSELNIL